MGARLTDPRWFRDAAQIEHRLWINNASHSDLEKRKDDLEMVMGISFLSVQSTIELWRIREAQKQRWHEQSRWRLRCPICGGWAYYGRSSWLDGGTNVIPLCRECGWPKVENILLGDIVIRPRTAYRLYGDEF